MAFLLKSIYIHLICYKNLNLNLVLTKWSQNQEAESQWVDGDFVRFRYGLPEKIGGWSSTY